MQNTKEKIIPKSKLLQIIPIQIQNVKLQKSERFDI